MWLPRTAILQKAMYSIGRSWQARFAGEDKEWGGEAEKVLENWFKLCDVRGGVFTWQTLLTLDSIALDRDGDFAIHLMESENGYPLMQRISSARIKNRHGQTEIEEGEYAGLKISNGIIKNKYGRALAYQVCGDEPSDDVIIEAKDIILPFDPDWHDQSRGTPAFSHCMNEMRDMLQSQQYEQMVMQMLSSIGLIEYNDTGEPRDEDDLVNGVTTDSRIQTSTFFEGQTRHYKSDSGNKLEAFQSDRPGDMWDRFQDRLARACIVGLPWSYSMVWKATGQGTAERSDMQKAQKAVDDRQDVIMTYAHRIISWAIAKFIKMGRLSQPKNPNDWYKWTFTLPPKISIDFKNDTNALMYLWGGGKLNDGDILGMFGKTTIEHYIERANEIADRKLIAAQVSEARGVSIEDREMAMLTPNEPKEQPEESKENNNE